jgi:hypothetical protein
MDARRVESYKSLVFDLEGDAAMTNRRGSSSFHLPGTSTPPLASVAGTGSVNAPVAATLLAGIGAKGKQLVRSGSVFLKGGSSSRNTEEVELSLHERVKLSLIKPEASRTAKDYKTLLAFTEEIAFFGKYDKETVEEMCRIMRYELAVPGSIIFRKGDAGDKFYIILSGEVGIYRKGLE